MSRCGSLLEWELHMHFNARRDDTYFSDHSSDTVKKKKTCMVDAVVSVVVTFVYRI